MKHAEIELAQGRPLPESELKAHLSEAESLHAASTDFERMVGPVRLKAAANIAETLEAVGEDEKAIPYYVVAIARAREADSSFLPPQALAMHLNNAGLCYKKLGEYSLAIPLYREAARLSPGELTTTNLSKLEARLNRPLPPMLGSSYTPEDVEPMTLEHSDAARERLRELGNDAFRSRRFDAATRWYTAALANADCPASSRAKLLCNRSAARFEAQDYNSAVVDARQATVLDPDFAKAWYRLGQALQHSSSDAKSGVAGAAEAYEIAHALAPEDSSIGKALLAAQQAAVAGHSKPPARWAMTPLGRLDRLVGAEGLEAACPRGSLLRSAVDATQQWHDGLRIAQKYRGFALAVGQAMFNGVRACDESGNADFFHLCTDPVERATAVRQLSDALWTLDAVWHLPLDTWIDGRRYSIHLTSNAINGLDEALMVREEVLRISVTSGTPGGCGKPFMDERSFVHTLLSADLTDDACCEKLELTLRVQAVLLYAFRRSLQSSRGAISGDTLVVLAANCARLERMRAILVRRAMELTSPPIEGVEPAAITGFGDRLSEPINHRALLPIEDDIHALALSWLRSQGTAADRLASVLDTPWMGAQWLEVMLQTIHTPTKVFSDAQLDVLYSYFHVHQSASLLAATFPDDPCFPAKRAFAAFELATQGPGALPSGAPPEAAETYSYRAAARDYAEAARLAAASAAHHSATGYLWEQANALGYCGGDDGRGVSVGTLRELAAAAEAAQAAERDVLAAVPESQAEQMVRAVLSAMSAQLPHERLSPPRYKQLTADLLLKQRAAHLPEAQENTRARMGLPRRVASDMGAELGPAWIAGRPPPPPIRPTLSELMSRAQEAYEAASASGDPTSTRATKLLNEGLSADVQRETADGGATEDELIDRWLPRMENYERARREGTMVAGAGIDFTSSPLNQAVRRQLDLERASA